MWPEKEQGEKAAPQVDINSTILTITLREFKKS